MDIIEASDEKMTEFSVKHLLQTDCIYEHSSVTARPAFLILKQQLNKLSGELNSQVELVALIKQFKEKFEHNEM